MARGISKETLAALHAIPLFSRCTQKELTTIAQLGAVTQIDAGTTITKEGAHGAELVIVLDGEARCLVDGKEVTRFGAGDFFGEISLLDNGPRSATVIADTAIEALVLESREFRRLVEASPEIAWKMLVALAGRLRGADELLHD